MRGVGKHKHEEKEAGAAAFEEVRCPHSLSRAQGQKHYLGALRRLIERSKGWRALTSPKQPAGRFPFRSLAATF